MPSAAPKDEVRLLKLTQGVRRHTRMARVSLADNIDHKGTNGGDGEVVSRVQGKR